MGPSPPPVRTDRPLGGGGLPPPPSTPPCYGKKRAGGAGSVPNPSRTRREPVANLSRTLPEPVLKPYLIKTLLVEFGGILRTKPPTTVAATVKNAKSCQTLWVIIEHDLTIESISETHLVYVSLWLYRQLI